MEIFIYSDVEKNIFLILEAYNRVELISYLKNKIILAYHNSEKLSFDGLVLYDIEKFGNIEGKHFSIDKLEEKVYTLNDFIEKNKKSIY